jgi:hypothetical protein
MGARRPNPVSIKQRLRELADENHALAAKMALNIAESDRLCMRLDALERARAERKLGIIRHTNRVW